MSFKLCCVEINGGGVLKLCRLRGPDACDYVSWSTAVGSSRCWVSLCDNQKVKQKAPLRMEETVGRVGVILVAVTRAL